MLTAHKNACATIEALEKHIRDRNDYVKVEANQEVKEQQLVIDELKDKICKLEDDVRSRDTSIHSLKNAREAAQSVASKLNKGLSDNRIRFKEEKIAF